jgi:RNA polymerase sigma factor (sigma-70 family)
MWVNGNNDWEYNFLNGDKIAFNEVYKLNYHPLYIFVINLINNKEDTKDLVAESFQKLLKTKAEFQSRSDIKPYLFVIARNACIDYLKSGSKSREFKIGMAGAYDGQTPDLSQEIIGAEILRLIIQEIDRLPPQQSRVLKMILLEDLKPEQVGEIMGIKPRTVCSTKTTALKSLRIALLSKKKSWLSLLFHVLLVLCSTFPAFF